MRKYLYVNDEFIEITSTKLNVIRSIIEDKFKESTAPPREWIWKCFGFKGILIEYIIPYRRGIISVKLIECGGDVEPKEILRQYYIAKQKP